MIFGVGSTPSNSILGNFFRNYELEFQTKNPPLPARLIEKEMDLKALNSKAKV